MSLKSFSLTKKDYPTLQSVGPKAIVCIPLGKRFDLYLTQLPEMLDPVPFSIITFGYTRVL